MRYEFYSLVIAATVLICGCNKQEDHPYPFADYDGKGYATTEDQEHFEEALRREGIAFIYRDEPYFDGMIFWHKSDTPKVDDVARDLFGEPPGVYSLGSPNIEKLQKIEDALRNEGIDAAMTHYHGESFVYWPQYQDSEATKIVLKRFDIDVERTRNAAN